MNGTTYILSLDGNPDRRFRYETRREALSALCVLYELKVCKHCDILIDGSYESADDNSGYYDFKDFNEFFFERYYDGDIKASKERNCRLCKSFYGGCVLSDVIIKREGGTEFSHVCNYFNKGLRNDI